ncbi:hypothetical protein SUGI_0747660 [Cryptomeria japonica]|nr:hypothetical protein SUGI_0747660 [Cryptomeria japonica]
MDLDKSIIINQAFHGCELAKDLQNKLHSTSQSELDLNDIIGPSVEIVNTFGKVLELLGYNSNQFVPDEDIQRIGQSQAMPIIDSKLYGASSLTNLRSPGKLKSPAESSDKEKPSEEESPKRRKNFPRWNLRVPAASISETGSDGPTDDGFSWRKYGQKDILGSQYPRSYYRCTHKTDMGCRAKKQVQRANDDPSFFDVIYIGGHCCQINPQVLEIQNFYGPPQIGSTGMPTVPSTLLFGGSQPESSTGHVLLSAIQGETSRSLLTRDPVVCKEETDKGYDFGKAPLFPYNPDLVHMTQHAENPTENPNLMDYYRFWGAGQQDPSTNPANIPLPLFREEKNLIDFLPQQAKEYQGPSCSEGEPSFVSFFGPSVGSESSFMDMMDSGDSVSPHMQASKSEFTDAVSGETSSSPMLDLDIMFHTDELSEHQLGEKLPWNIKKP